ncbi:MAG: DUF2851 family protein [Flavobacteriia bacterium]|jgi:hypothetical protein
MKEEYLHAIWRMKRLPVSQLYLTDGRKLTIKKTGWHNHDAGPDFFNGSIEIDGIQWNGNIELHVKSSDWYVHKHHLDQAYNSVVLHVVFQHDKEVLIHEQKIPTLELQNLIDFNHWNLYRSLTVSSSWIPCENSIATVDEFIVQNQIETALIERLNRKNEILKQTFRELQGNHLALYYEIFAKAFGLKVNTLPFIELTKKLDIKILWKENPRLQKVLLLGVSGMLQEANRFGFEEFLTDWGFLKKKCNLDEMDFHSWKFKGLRPQSFPNIKILQFAEICSKQELFNLNHFNETEILIHLNNLNFSENFRNNLLINAIIPIIWWNYSFFQDEKLRDLALNLLMKLPSEQNQIISKWKNLTVKCKSSYQSQGLLELKNELCAHKKCLNCKIGFAILKQ